MSVYPKRRDTEIEKYNGPSTGRSQCVVEYSILYAQEPGLKKVGTNNS